MYVQLRWQLESRSVKSGWNYSGCLYMALFFLATCNGEKGVRVFTKEPQSQYNRVFLNSNYLMVGCEFGIFMNSDFLFLYIFICNKDLNSCNFLCHTSNIILWQVGSSIKYEFFLSLVQIPFNIMKLNQMCSFIILYCNSYFNIIFLSTLCYSKQIYVLRFSYRNLLRISDIYDGSTICLLNPFILFLVSEGIYYLCRL